MASEKQSVATSDRTRCLRLRERIDEDPARWLDWYCIPEKFPTTSVRNWLDIHLARNREALSLCLDNTAGTSCQTS